ncbi:hypothetical protein OAM52_01470 [Flavobacteriaceae bacterium]|nr:hypothetical protein [Flavobacteriaceae bacterium]MDC0570602.1 hypothetical protein [Flavobacteriaceae bacterium]
MWYISISICSIICPILKSKLNDESALSKGLGLTGTTIPGYHPD